MSLTPYTWRKASLNQIDAYWRDLDLRIEDMHVSERQMQEEYNRLTDDDKKAKWSAGIKRQQAEIKRVLELQSEVEMYLIEHEAEGWTST